MLEEYSRQLLAARARLSLMGVNQMPRANASRRRVTDFDKSEGAKFLRARCPAQ